MISNQPNVNPCERIKYVLVLMFSKPVRFTKHATAKCVKEGINQSHAVQAVCEGSITPEGGGKFKAILRKNKAWIIAVCQEYEDHILVITVIRKQGDLSW